MIDFRARAKSIGSPRFAEYIVLILMLVGALLRLHGLASQSLWADESLVSEITQNSVADICAQVQIRERTPPLYYIFMHYWTASFGTSEFSLRLPSVIFGVLAIFLVYRLARELFDDRVGMLAAAMLTFSRYHIYYSQEARAYMLFAVLTMASCLACLFVVRRGSWKSQAAYIVLATLLLYSHIYGTFVLIAQQVAVLSLYSCKQRVHVTFERWISISGAILALFSPWIAVYLYWMHAADDNWFFPMSVSTIADAFHRYCGSWPALGLTLLLSVFSIVHMIRRRTWDGMLMLVGLMIFPLLFPLVASILWHPIFSFRYGMPATIVLAILASHGLIALTDRPLQITYAAMLVGITCWNFARPIKEGDWITKPDWRAAASIVYSHDPQAVVALNVSYDLWTFPYYAERYPEHDSIRNFATISTSTPHFWLVTCEPPRNARSKPDDRWQTLRTFTVQSVTIEELWLPPVDSTTSSPSPPPVR